MSKTLHKVTRDCFYDSTDEEIREHGRKCGGIYIFYGFNNYREDMEQLMELFDIIKNDWPNITLRDVAVWKIREHESRWVAHHTMLQFNIPAEDFIRMRNSKEIYSL